MIWFILLCLLSWTSAQGWNVNVSICSWDQLRVSTIRDTVYLDGGSLWWQRKLADGTSSPMNDDNKHGLLYSLSLSSSFDANTNLTALFSNISKAGGVANNIAPNYRDGVMFANDNQLYLYGGLLRLTDSQDPPGNNVLGYERYQYGPERQSWQPGFIIDDLDGEVTRYVTNGAGVSVPSENLGFYFSGMRAANWGPIYVNDESANVTSNRMIKVDMSAMRQNKWSNLTLPDYVPPRANAELVWVPVSTSGVLVAIGGVVNPSAIFAAKGLSNEQKDTSKKISPGFMKTVSVYDIASDKWYTQTTTGDIPPQLTQFCSIYASASDGSSHNIYIYGGYDGLSDESVPSDDVYVLSLPSFTWIKLYSGDRSHGRSGHRCVKPYPDQMLILGGMHTDPSQCLDVVKVFNLNTGRFQNSYDPKKWSDYAVPALVTAVIGGDPKGGATKTPSWTNSSLATVFAAKYTKPIKTWYPNTDQPSMTPVPSNTQSAPFPGWAGAILGVVLGLALIAAGFLFWCLRRRRRFEQSADSRSWILRWMHADSTVGMSKTNETVSTGRSFEEKPSTAVSPRSVEAGGEPVYEMLDKSTAPPVELPTVYNNPPSPMSTSVSAYMSPTVSTPSNDGEPNRPHRRQVSSLSSVPSIANVIRSDMSVASFESEGLGIRPVELSGSSVDRLATTQEVDEAKELP